MQDTIGELQSWINQKEANLLKQQVDVANGEMQLITLRSDLSAAESRRSAYDISLETFERIRKLLLCHIRLRILRDQLQVLDAMLQESSEKETSLRAKLERINDFKAP